jgi:hypothetical protein
MIKEGTKVSETLIYLIGPETHISRTARKVVWATRQKADTQSMNWKRCGLARRTWPLKEIHKLFFFV